MNLIKNDSGIKAIKRALGGKTAKRRKGGVSKGALAKAKKKAYNAGVRKGRKTKSKKSRY